MAYCSDACQNIEATSPSISSASSARSSPRIPYATGGDVPPLVSSALGSIPRNRNRHSMSSSSASSVSFSVLTDDDNEDNALVGTADENSYLHDVLDAHYSIYDANLKSLGHFNSHKSSGLSYARRPSSTNTRSTIPLLHRRTSSGSHSGHEPPLSAPSIHSATEDEEDPPQVTYPSRDLRSASYRDKPTSTITAKSKRTHNRASLPAYFSLLQLSGNSPSKKAIPMSSPPNKTTSRSSPPTPKLALPSRTVSSLAEPTLTASVVYAGVGATPRGRKREAGASRGNRFLVSSRSRSRGAPPRPQQADATSRARLGNRSSVEKVFDWTSSPLPRGRPTTRRNSSPLPKMLMSAAGIDEQNVADYQSRVKTRGRMRTEEINGSADAPGYGNGRSGLKDRERSRGTR